MRHSYILKTRHKRGGDQ